jgi:hypothetical protein
MINTSDGWSIPTIKPTMPTVYISQFSSTGGDDHTIYGVYSTPSKAVEQLIVHVKRSPKYNTRSNEEIKAVLTQKGSWPNEDHSGDRWYVELWIVDD